MGDIRNVKQGEEHFVCLLPRDRGTQSWRKWCSTETRQVAGVAVVSCHLECFSH